MGAASAVFSLIALLLAFTTLIVVITDDDSGGGATTAAGAVSVGLKEFAIEPAPLQVDADAKLNVINNGAVPHNLVIETTDKKTKDLNNGDSATIDLAGVEPGEYTMYCAIPGHREAGMQATLAVGVELSPEAKGSGSTGKTPQELLGTNEADDAAQKVPVDSYVSQVVPIVEKFVAEGAVDASLYEPNTSYPSFEEDPANNPLLGPPVMPFELEGDTKVFDVTAKVVDWEIEPGKIVSAWTYNGSVPGPTIKVEPGDKIKIVLHNELPQSTAIHSHGFETPVAMDGVPWVTQDPVLPGDTFEYVFTAPSEPMVGMYHSHHHAEKQVPDGLFGAFIVGDFTEQIQAVTGKPAAASRIPMVLNDAGSIGLSLNGKSFPATAPVVGSVGSWVQIEYMNEGLQIHPMHLHGLPQVVIAKDGVPLPQPYAVDTLNVAPGERYTVLIHAEEQFLDHSAEPRYAGVGVWAFHCHILNHAARNDGRFGMVTTYLVVP